MLIAAFYLYPSPSVNKINHVDMRKRREYTHVMKSTHERQTMMIGDCLNCLAELDEATIDVIVTSPPYNIGIAYGSYDDRKPRDQYLLWLREVAVALRRVMKPDASCFLNVGGTNIDPWLSHDVAAAFRDHFVLQNHIIWLKSINIDEDTIGHFKPINSSRFLNYNHEAIFHFTKSGNVPIDRLAIGAPYKDKCHGAGTKLIKSDGASILVEDVVIGTLLMGPDSKPRCVLNTHHGKGSLYRVYPVYGESFVVNGDHQLILTTTMNRWGRSRGDLVVVSVEEYLQNSVHWQRKHMLQYPNGIDMPEANVEIDPYFLGLWLGDGSSYCSSITTGDPEIVDFLSTYATNKELNLRVYDLRPGCGTYAITGERGSRRKWTIRDGLKHYKLLRNKHIPDVYLRNSRSVRSELLSGLLDSDGWLANPGSMGFTNTNEQLIEQVTWLARSLGFRVTKQTAIQKVNGNNYVSFKLLMKGDFANLPLRLERKRPGHSLKKNHHMNTGFSIKPCEEEGDYYGFELDGDHLYLAHNFIICHNSNLARRGHAEDKHCAGNCWLIPYDTVQSKAQKFDHPAGFPIKLASQCIKLHGVLDALVLDPFAGTGSTLVAAAQLGCSGIGIELDPGYAATAIARLQASQEPTWLSSVSP